MIPRTIMIFAAVYKKIHRILSSWKSMALPVFPLLFMFVPWAVHADIIYLRDGTRVEGLFQYQEGSNFIFETFDGKVSIPSKNIVRMEMGYTGIPICYSTKDGKVKNNCNAILHLLDDDEALIVNERGSLKRTSVDPDDISFLEFRKEKPGQRVITLLGPGVGIKTVVGGKTINGAIEEVDEGELLVEQEDGEKVSLMEESLRSGVLYIPEKKLYFDFQYSDIIPGYSQYAHGEYFKGSAILGGLVIFGAGLAAEYQATVALSSQAMNDPAFLIYNDPSYKKQFETHKQNQAMFGFALAAVYGYHLYDSLFSLDGSGRNDIKTSLLFDLKPEFTAEREDRSIATGNGVRLGFSFQMRF